MSRALPVAWYRFRSTLRRQLPAYLSIVLLVGLVGGLAMASLAGARRTQSSYPTFLASTNPSDLTVSSGSLNSDAANGSSAFTKQISHLPGVKRLRDLIAPTVIPLTNKGAARVQLANVLEVYGSLDGELRQQDRLTVIKGHLTDPNQADQVEMTANAAEFCTCESVKRSFSALSPPSKPVIRISAPPRCNLACDLRQCSRASWYSTTRLCKMTLTVRSALWW